MTDDVDRYLHRLERRLALRTEHAGSVIEEVADHLHDTRDELLAAGHTEAEATRLALARFGAARTVARGFRRTWLPIGHELGWLLATAMVAVGLAGLGAAAVRAVVGGMAGIADADGEVSARNLQRIMIGFAGLCIGELLYLRRRGRTVRPRSPITIAGLAGLVAGGVWFAALAAVAASSDAAQMPGRWVSLSVALGIGAFEYRRHLMSAAPAPHPRR